MTLFARQHANAVLAHLPAVWANDFMPVCNFTRKVALGRSSLTTPFEFEKFFFCIRPLGNPGGECTEIGQKQGLRGPIHPLSFKCSTQISRKSRRAVSISISTLPFSRSRRSSDLVVAGRAGPCRGTRSGRGLGAADGLEVALADPE